VERVVDLTDVIACDRSDCRPQSARQLAQPVIEQLTLNIAIIGADTMAEHIEFTLASDVQVYFCDPGHPWQRGTAENTIGLVRAYIPKGGDLSRYRRAQLAAIAEMLNERPRKTLAWRSPAEAYAELLAVQ
jgi:transposase, IS30 family